MALEHIIVTMTYVMWREEHLLNVSILQRVHLSNVVKIIAGPILHIPCRLNIQKRPAYEFPFLDSAFT
jgi:hypothetical protein